MLGFDVKGKGVLGLPNPSANTKKIYLWVLQKKGTSYLPLYSMIRALVHCPRICSL